MVEQSAFLIRVGAWFDEHEGRPLRPLADGQFSDLPASPESLADAVVSAARDSDLNPWEHELTISHYYANASSSAWGLVVSIAPYLGSFVSEENARTVAGAFLGAIFARLVGSKSPPTQTVDITEASRAAQGYVCQRDNLAPNQVQEVSAHELAEGGFELLLKRVPDDHLLLVRLDSSAFIVARFDISELIRYIAESSVSRETDA